MASRYFDRYKFVVFSSLALCHACKAPNSSKITDVMFSFTTQSGQPKRLSLSEIQSAITPVNIHIPDPLYGRIMNYRALPLAAVLHYGFTQADATTSATQLTRADFLIRCQDGYTVPVSAKILFETGGFLAIADLDHPNWLPIGKRGVNPGPALVVWQAAHQTDEKIYPRPWQVVGFEQKDLSQQYHYTKPHDATADASAKKGHQLFMRDCVRCHAINRQGGTLGPDLNVPQSIVEYRPIEQIKQYIRNPLTFRYGTMPAQPQLSDLDLNALIAYFSHMKMHKHE